MHSYSLGKCKGGGVYATPEKGVGLKMQEGMPGYL